MLFLDWVYVEAAAVADIVVVVYTPTDDDFDVAMMKKKIRQLFVLR
jgi:hypothetical protein